MSRFFSLISFLILSYISAFGQSEYVSGYYIDINGDKVEGLILLDFWDDTPQEFSFKDNASGPEVRLTSKNAKIIDIDDQRYELLSLDIDWSSENLETMSTSRNPDFQNETLFTQVLVNGDPSLYGFKGKGIERFFYKKNDQVIPQQLVYKPFLTGQLDGDGKPITSVNRQYLQQLFTDYSSDGLTQEMIKDLRYKSSDLANLFVRINKFQTATYEKYKIGKKKTRFSATFKAGYYSLSSKGRLISPFEENLTFNFPGNGVFTYGLETEYLLLPKQSLAVYLEASSFDYSGETMLEGGNVTSSDVEFLMGGTDVALGLKKYFTLIDNKSIFLKAGYLRPFELGIAFTYINAVRPIKNENGGMVFSGGLLVDNWQLELRYNYRETFEYTAIEGEINVSSISAYIGYRF